MSLIDGFLEPEHASQMLGKLYSAGYEKRKLIQLIV